MRIDELAIDHPTGYRSYKGRFDVGRDYTSFCLLYFSNNEVRIGGWITRSALSKLIQRLRTPDKRARAGAKRGPKGDLEIAKMREWSLSQQTDGNQLRDYD